MDKTTDWMQGYSGKKLYPLEPDMDQIVLWDIAHALSMICRYGGHSRDFYSVAERCILMAEYARDFLKRPDLAFSCLMHDAAEAYLLDIPRPVKRELYKYSEMEAVWERLIFSKYKVVPLKQEVKILDDAILRDEAKRLFRKPIDDWHLMHSGLDVEIICMDPYSAERAFLDLFHELKPA